MEFDPRLTNLGIKATQTTNATWDVKIVKYQDETEAGGNHNIYFTVQDANGQAMSGITCIVDWIGREPNDPPTRVTTDAHGQGNVPIYANLDITLKNGPYFAFVADQTQSDVVSGMGLPEHRHVNYLLTFAQPGSTPPAPTLEQTVSAAAKKLTWMPINTDGALYKFAQIQNLGYPQTDEFEFAVGADGYVGQVYNLGIVYVKKGDWSNCQWVKKP